MAKIKIERSKRSVTEYQAPQLGGASLPSFQIGGMVVGKKDSCYSALPCQYPSDR